MVKVRWENGRIGELKNTVAKILIHKGRVVPVSDSTADSEKTGTERTEARSRGGKSKSQAAGGGKNEEDEAKQK